MTQGPDACHCLARDHPFLAALRLKPQFILIVDRYQSCAEAGIVRKHYTNFLNQSIDRIGFNGNIFIAWAIIQFV